MTRLCRTLAVTSLALGAAVPVRAQAPMMRPQHATLNLAAGVSVWDLSGTGNSIIFAARLDRPLGVHWLLGEGSLATFTTDEQGGSNTYLIPEVQLQLQVPRVIAPYVGGGFGGFGRVAGDASRDMALTTSAAAGVRLWGIIPRGVLRAEVRLRGIGREFTGSAFETTGGVGWSF
jgi:hypothetical protein